MIPSYIETLQPDSIPKGSEKTFERRKSERFCPKNTAFVLLRTNLSSITNMAKMSFGQIGFAVFKSNPDLIGEITNISVDGLGFNYIGEKIQTDSAAFLDVLSVDQKFNINQLWFRTILDTEIPGEFAYGPHKFRRAGIEFLSLNPYQKILLQKFCQMNKTAEI